MTASYTQVPVAVLCLNNVLLPLRNPVYILNQPSGFANILVLFSCCFQIPDKSNLMEAKAIHFGSQFVGVLCYYGEDMAGPVQGWHTVPKPIVGLL